MVIIVLIIMTLLIALSKYTVSDKLSKVFIYLYLLWWFMWLFISALDVYGLFTVSAETYLIIFMSLFLFLIGFLFGKSQKNVAQSEVTKINSINIRRNVLLNIILSFAFVILAYYFIRYLSLSQTIPTAELRMLRFSVGPLFSSTKLLLFFNFFIEAIIFFLYAIISYQIIHRDMKNYTFVIALASLVMYAAIGSGRFPIIYLLMALVLMFFIGRITVDEKASDTVDDLKHLQARKTSILILLLVMPQLMIYAAYLTAFRLGEYTFNFESIIIGMNELLRQFIIYFTGSFRALDYGLANLTSEVPLLFGQGTFAGVNEILHAVLHILGIEIQNTNYLIGEYLQNRSILIGVNIFHNYAYTSIMIFFFDFGIFGAILFSFLFGFFARKVIFTFNNKPTVPSLVLVVFIFQGMIFSVFNWVFQSPAAVITISICIIWQYFSKKEVADQVTAWIED